MQKPAARKPSEDAIAAAEALKRPQQQGMGCAASGVSSTSSSPALTAAAQGTKRKRGEEEGEAECESSVCEDGGSAAAEAAKPLC